MQTLYIHATPTLSFTHTHTHISSSAALEEAALEPSSSSELNVDSSVSSQGEW